MKTVTHNGKVYKIGAIYFDGLNSLVKLTSIKNGEFYYIDGSGNEGSDLEIYSVECSEYVKGAKLGTIEDAPIELESGHCYYCEINQNTEKLEYATMFFHEGEWYWDSELSDVCKDFALRYIKPLYKMVRAS